MNIGSYMFYASILSYNEDSIKCLMLKNVGKLRPTYKIDVEVFPHKKPISFPVANNLLICSNLSLSLALQMNIIYEFQIELNQFVLVTDNKENYVYHSAFKE